MPTGTTFVSQAPLECTLPRHLDVVASRHPDVKMILAHTAWKIDTLVSLGVIVLILAVSIVMSLLRPKKVAIPTVVPNPNEAS